MYACWHIGLTIPRIRWCIRYSYNISTSCIALVDFITNMVQHILYWIYIRGCDRLLKHNVCMASCCMHFLIMRARWETADYSQRRGTPVNCMRYALSRYVMLLRLYLFVMQLNEKSMRSDFWLTNGLVSIYIPIHIINQT